MRLPTTIFGHGRRVVKALESRAWYRLERFALWTLARSGRHVDGEYRLSLLRRTIRHSEAWKKGAVVSVRPWISTADRN